LACWQFGQFNGSGLPQPLHCSLLAVLEHPQLGQNIALPLGSKVNNVEAVIRRFPKLKG